MFGHMIYPRSQIIPLSQNLFTALASAADKGLKTACEILLEAGAQIEAKDDVRGTTDNCNFGTIKQKYVVVSLTGGSCVVPDPDVEENFCTLKI